MKLAATILLVALNCQAIDDVTAIRAVIGEAAGCGYADKLAVAGAIRNGQGKFALIGLRNTRMIDRQSKRTFTEAARAWSESATNDASLGATHFEANRFGRPWWSTNMVVAARTASFTFYKEKK